MKATIKHIEQVQPNLKPAVDGLVRNHGLPLSLDELDDYLDVLLPAVKSEAAALVDLERAAILDMFPHLQVPHLRTDVPPYVVYSAIAEAAGLKRPSLKAWNMADRDMLAASVVRLALPALDEGELLTWFAGRLLSSMGTKAKYHARRLPIVTAKINKTRYARVLNAGACGWCAMQASRGAVFVNESTANFAAHDNCNCSATVVTGDGYEDQELTDRLYHMWKHSEPTDTQNKNTVFAQNWAKLQEKEGLA